MTEFKVWAPERQVSVRVAGVDHDMRRAEDGWWQADVPAAGHGKKKKKKKKKK